MAGQLVNDMYTDVFDAFTRANAATMLGWRVIFVGRSERHDRWLVWTEVPGDISADDARLKLDAKAEED